MDKLKEYYSDSGLERVGFILKDDTIIEVTNISANPMAGFEISIDDIEKYENTLKATWHTHPGVEANLSVDDFTTYLNWPDLEHYVVGSNGVRRFVIEDGKVVNG